MEEYTVQVILTARQLAILHQLLDKIPYEFVNMTQEILDQLDAAVAHAKEIAS